MKVREIDGERDDGFRPFTLAFTFETEGEARLMWHVFNHNKLWSDMSSEGYGGSGYIKPAPNFTKTGNSHEVRDLICDHVRVKTD